MMYIMPKVKRAIVWFVTTVVLFILLALIDIRLVSDLRICVVVCLFWPRLFDSVFAKIGPYVNSKKIQ